MINKKKVFSTTLSTFLILSMFVVFTSTFQIGSCNIIYSNEGQSSSGSSFFPSVQYGMGNFFMRYDYEAQSNSIDKVSIIISTTASTEYRIDFTSTGNNGITTYKFGYFSQPYSFIDDFNTWDNGAQLLSQAIDPQLSGTIGINVNNITNTIYLMVYSDISGWINVGSCNIPNGMIGSSLLGNQVMSLDTINWNYVLFDDNEPEETDIPDPNSVLHVSFPFEENGIIRYQVDYGAVLTVTETQNRDLYCDYGTVLTLYGESNEGYYFDLMVNGNYIISGTDITIIEDTTITVDSDLISETDYPELEYISYINISPPTHGYIWININGVYHNYTSTSNYDTLNVSWNTRIHIGYVSQDAYELNRFYTNINEYYFNESDVSITFDNNYTLSLENDFYIVFGYPWDTDIYPDGIFNYIVDVWATLQFTGATATPNPSSLTPFEPIIPLETGLALFGGIFVTMLFAILFAVLAGKDGLIAGLVTGLFVSVLLGLLPIWTIILVIILGAWMILDKSGVTDRFTGGN